MGASFILAINIALGIAIMVSFLAFGLFDRTQRAAFWWFAACIFAVISGAIEYAMPPITFTGSARFLIFSAFAVSVSCLSIGLALRYVGRIPWVPIGIGFALSLICYASIAELPRQSMARNIGYQAPYAGLQLIGLYYVWKGMKPDILDRAVFGGVLFNMMQYLARPPMVLLFGGNGSTPQQYLSTDYAMASQTLMAIASIILAFLLGIRMLADVLSGIQTRSQIDHLSGMLNRDACQHQIETILATSRRNGLPMTLLLCDLDHFKSINDTYGHQVGDAVIAAFGRLIDRSKRADDISGRMGGEEFCVLLRHCDAPGARLFAEHLRIGFSSLDFGLSHVKGGFTASFGLYVIKAGDTFDSAYAQADAALYEAKRSGRNRVCLNGAAVPSASEEMVRPFSLIRGDRR
ncbi:GGDEF domain-containing protein [Pararhizobium haloflavum]|uniref:GGDEF domain-containing protein n=1 Tax=Pararhizobium haloflavum TaxID=2037914 RepID=UPI000C1761A2|nr:GGDEF domain-containing protein [Pararhizobium haloflavum]